jgi:hypothetical protein
MMEKMMMYTPSMLRELWIFKIILIYVNFFLEFIDNEKIEESDETYDDE